MTNNSNSSTVLLCAYTLAKAKHYAEAEASILSHPEIAKTPPALDLLARLRIEQNDFIEARRIWEDLLSTHPNYMPARNALKHFDTKPSKIKKTHLIIGAMLLLFGLGLFLGRSLTTSRIPHVPTPIVYTFDTFPRYDELQQLQKHRGKIERISISSHLFANPTALARRNNLMESISHLLDLAPHSIYFAPNISTASPEAITLLVETH